MSTINDVLFLAIFHKGCEHYFTVPPIYRGLFLSAAEYSVMIFVTFAEITNCNIPVILLANYGNLFGLFFHFVIFQIIFAHPSLQQLVYCCNILYNWYEYVTFLKGTFAKWI